MHFLVSHFSFNPSLRFCFRIFATGSKIFIEFAVDKILSEKISVQTLPGLLKSPPFQILELKSAFELATELDKSAALKVPLAHLWLLLLILVSLAFGYGLPTIDFDYP